MWKDVLPIGPVLFLLVVSVLERVTPNYDWRRNYVSELALKKYGWMQRMNLVIYGVWLVILSLVLAQKSQAGGWLWGECCWWWGGSLKVIPPYGLGPGEWRCLTCYGGRWPQDWELNWELPSG